MPSPKERFWEHESFAFVGDTAKKGFPTLSYGAMREQGRTVFAIDASADSIDGDPAYRDFASLPQPVEAALLEVSPEDTAAWVTSAADAGVKAVWIHMGRDTPAALQVAEERGLEVMTGSCAVMYVKRGFSYHTLHKWVEQLARRY